MTHSTSTRFIFKLLMFFCFLFSSSAMAAKPIAPTCEGSVLQACIGECGNPFIGDHLVTLEDASMSPGKRRASFCLRIDREMTSLCPSEDIRYRLSVNGDIQNSGEIAYGSGFPEAEGLITVSAKDGDVVGVELEHFANELDIACFRLGEAYIDLGYVKK